MLNKPEKSKAKLNLPLIIHIPSHFLYLIFILVRTIPKLSQYGMKYINKSSICQLNKFDNCAKDVLENRAVYYFVE